jgi:hypothetical protein
MPNARRPDPRVKRRRRRRVSSAGANIPKPFLAETAEDFERLLAAEGMPAEPRPTRYTWTNASDRSARDREHARWVALKGTATREFYDRARDLLNSGQLQGEALTVWEAVCEGLGERAIAGIVGRTRGYNYNWFIGPFREYIGLPTRAFRVPAHRRPRRSKRRRSRR